MQFLLFINSIVKVCCSPAFILKRSIVSEPSVLLPAAALTGNGQKRKERRMKRANKHGEGSRTFTFQSSSRGAVDKVIYSAAALNCLITGVLPSYDCTGPIKVRYLLLLNSLLDFAYNNAINRD